MHRVTWSSPNNRRPPVRWLVPDGLLRANHAVLANSGILGLVLVGRRGVLLTANDRQDLQPDQPISCDTGNASLRWQPIAEAPAPLGPESTCDDPDLQDRHRFKLELDGVERTIPQTELLLVGRHPASDLRLQDPRVSSLHCALVASELGVRVVDLDSANGTRIDGTRVHAATVTRRAALRLGPIGALLRPTLSRDNDLVRLPSQAMQRIYALVERIAPSEAPVLIEGESGTGKEGIARSLHELSGRQGRFETLNAALLTPELAASQLFGHVRGAFTGADADRAGAFARAGDGTLFLDEVGELRLDVQADLLRVIEERRVTPVGGGESTPVDVRVITATHRDLAAKVRQGIFRQDLFHRIWVLPVCLPPLRDRPDDVKALAAGFLARQGTERELSLGAHDKLLRHSWPGNIRELLNVLKRACAMTDAAVIEPQHVVFSATLDSAGTLDNVVRQSVLSTYAKHGGSVAATARELGIHRATVYRHLRQARNARMRME